MNRSFMEFMHRASAHLRKKINGTRTSVCALAYIAWRSGAAYIGLLLENRVNL
jgi:hypothetical protein